MKHWQNLIALEYVETPSSLWFPCLRGLAVLDADPVERVRLLCQSPREAEVNSLLLHFRFLLLSGLQGLSLNLMLYIVLCFLFPFSSPLFFPASSTATVPVSIPSSLFSLLASGSFIFSASAPTTPPAVFFPLFLP